MTVFELESTLQLADLPFNFFSLTNLCVHKNLKFDQATGWPFLSEETFFSCVYPILALFAF